MKIDWGLVGAEVGVVAVAGVVAVVGALVGAGVVGALVGAGVVGAVVGALVGVGVGAVEKYLDSKKEKKHED